MKLLLGEDGSFYSVRCLLNATLPPPAHAPNPYEASPRTSPPDPKCLPYLLISSSESSTSPSPTAAETWTSASFREEMDKFDALRRELELA
jgi:hypothetical protein